MSAFLLILFILAIAALTGFRLWNNSPKHKGEVGEARVNEILSQLPDGYKIMNDIVLKTPKGTTQIDHVVVSKYGVFAIETKNYRGDIYGDDNRREWTQIIVTDVTYRRKWYKTYTYVTKNHFFNPVKQAYAHVFAIKKLLNNWSYLPLVPIVVFTGNANLSNVTTENHVVYDDNLLNTILGYNASYLSDSELDTVVNILAQNNIRAFVDDKTHVRNIRAAQKDSDKKISSGICPRCGGTLVKRTGKYGSFYGCSNYPNCKFTTK